MIIVCPSCEAKFNVDDALVATGRKVRCGECKHIWFYENELGEDDSGTVTGQEESFGGGSDDDDWDGAGKDNALSASIPGNLHPADDDFYNPEDDSLTVLPIGETVSATPAKSPLSFAGALFVFMCLFGATVAYSVGAKASVLKTWKPVALFYDAVGMTVPHIGQGLDVNNLVAKRSKVQGNDVLYIRGRIDNVADVSTVIPPLRVILQDGDMIVQQWNTPEENFKIGKGESVPFEYGLPQPRGEGDTVSIYFIDTAEK